MIRFHVPPRLRAAASGALGLAFVTAGGGVSAQGLISERNLASAVAVEIAQGAVKSCLEKGYRVSAAVVDRYAQLKALVRADGAGIHTLDTSQRKAYTSASLRAGTTQLDEGWRNNPAATGLRQVPNVLAVGGGIPIRVGDEVVGAVGVGGAPGGHLDDQCAQAGIDGARDHLK